MGAATLQQAGEVGAGTELGDIELNGAHVGLCRYTCCVTSSGGSSVLVDEASEAVVAHAGDGERRLDGLAQGVGRELSAGSEMANSQALPPRLGGCLPVRWLQRT